MNLRCSMLRILATVVLTLASSVSAADGTQWVLINSCEGIAPVDFHCDLQGVAGGNLIGFQVVSDIAYAGYFHLKYVTLWGGHTYDCVGYSLADANPAYSCLVQGYYQGGSGPYFASIDLVGAGHWRLEVYAIYLL